MQQINTDRNSLKISVAIHMNPSHPCALFPLVGLPQSWAMAFATFVSFVVVGGSFQSPPSRFARLVVKISVKIRKNPCYPCAIFPPATQHITEPSPTRACAHIYKEKCLKREKKWNFLNRKNRGNELMCNILQQIWQILKSLSSPFLERKSEIPSHKSTSNRTQIIRMQRINTDQEESVKICKNPCHPCAISSRMRGLVLKSLHSTQPRMDAATAAFGVFCFLLWGLLVV